MWRTFEGAEMAGAWMVCSSPMEISGSCYVFLFLALTVLKLIKWMIYISCPALLLLPCSAKMITKSLFQIFLSHKISQLCEIKDAILLQSWTKLCKRQNEWSLRIMTLGKWRKKLVEIMVLGNSKSKSSCELGNYYFIIVRNFIPCPPCITTPDTWIW